MSPGNTFAEMARKFEFYERFGVEEYYVYDPDRSTLKGWRRIDARLTEIPVMHGWVSPRLGIRFEFSEGTLKLFGPDNKPFVSYVDPRDNGNWNSNTSSRNACEPNRNASRLNRNDNGPNRRRQRAEQERQRAERLAAQLRALGIEPQG